MKAESDSHNFTYKLLIIIFAVVILGFSVVPVCNYFRSHTRDHTKDYGKLYRTGQITLHNGDIYVKGKGETFQFMYPPTAAVLLAPLSALGLLPFIVNFADLEFKSVNVIIIIVGLGLCLFYIISMPRYAQRTAHSDSIEYAMLLLLILIFTPLSFTYFYVWLLYPLVVALNILLTAQNSTEHTTGKVPISKS